MRFSLDRLGFPLVELPELDLVVALLPVTKPQLEGFLAAPTPYGDDWYRDLLTVAPRASWRRFEADTRERVFASGLRPQEAADYAAWLGMGFRLPSVSEWRAVDRLMTARRLDREIQDGLNSVAMSPVALRILTQTYRQTAARTLGGLGLWRGGFFEWVEHHDSPGGYGGLGQPRPEVQPTVFNPQLDPPIHPTGESRLVYFGCRVVRTLSDPSEEVGDFQL